MIHRDSHKGLCNMAANLWLSVQPNLWPGILCHNVVIQSESHFWYKKQTTSIYGLHRSITAVRQTKGHTYNGVNRSMRSGESLFPEYLMLLASLGKKCVKESS